MDVKRWTEATYFTAMYLFPVSTSSPSQTSCQVVACAKRKYAHRGVPVQVGLIWSSGTNNTTRCETRPEQEKQTHCGLSRKASNPFCSPTCKTTRQYECCCSLFQETHFASQLLPPFGLIDKKLRQFFRARVHLQDQMQEARWFLFLLKWWPCCCVLFSNSRNHPILPAPNTQTRT